MKKIILAVASVLALGMLVSCKQEVSGNLTVTDIQYNAYQATTETYYYKVEGSVKEVITQTTTTKTSSTADESKTVVKSTSDLNVVETNNVVTVTVSKNPTTNVTTYTIGIPEMKGKKTSVTKVGDNEPFDPEYSQDTKLKSTITIKQIGSTFYYIKNDSADQKYVIEDFNPTAATFDLSKLSELNKTTQFFGTPEYDEGKEWYRNKVEITTTPTYSLTYTKL